MWGCRTENKRNEVQRTEHYTEFEIKLCIKVKLQVNVVCGW